MMRCLLRNILVSLILFSIICSCDNSRKQDRLETVSVDSITELPLPSVPSGITTTEDRAAFVARHFWDALDFRSDPLAVDTAFMEQNFANFISVLAVTPQDRTGEAVQGLCKMALGNPDAFSLLESVAEKYLDDPNSPMRNEDLFILFLQDWESSDSVGEATRERAKFRLARAMKNRRGTLAADFRFVDRQGRETTLFKSLGTAATLLMFYDPDCPQCEGDQEGHRRLSGGGRRQGSGNRHSRRSPAVGRDKSRDAAGLDCRLRPRPPRRGRDLRLPGPPDPLPPRPHRTGSPQRPAPQPPLNPNPVD